MKIDAFYKKYTLHIEEGTWETLFVQGTRECVFWVSLAASFFLTIALITFHANDPGWSHSNHSVPVHNVCGPWGAWIADVLFSFFGNVAFVFPVSLVLYSYSLIHRRESEDAHFVDTFFRWIGYGIFLLSATGLVELHPLFPQLGENSGGLIGQEIVEVVHRILTNEYSTYSTYLLAIFSFFGIFIYSNGEGLKIKRLVTSLNHLTYFSKENTTIPDPAENTNTVSFENDKKQESITEESPQKHTHTLLPPLLLLRQKTHLYKPPSMALLEERSQQLESVLADFRVPMQVKEIHPGPVITRFDAHLSPNSKGSTIHYLSRDIARALSVESIRILDYPQKNVVQFEIPNDNIEKELFSTLLSSDTYQQATSALTLILGRDSIGQPVIANLARMPHLLIAGHIGTHVYADVVNTILLSLVYKSRPTELQFIFIDHERVILSAYENIPHLLRPLLKNDTEIAETLHNCIVEMEHRLQYISFIGAKNFITFNQKVTEAIEAGQPILAPLAEPLAKIDPTPETIVEPEVPEVMVENEEGKCPVIPTMTPFPYLVIFISELASINRESIIPLLEKGRAAGIHLITMTCHPTATILPHPIRSALPARLIYKVSSSKDSHFLLGQNGAESLLNSGDSLYLPTHANVAHRVHSVSVSDREIANVVRFIANAHNKENKNTMCEQINDPVYLEAKRFTSELHTVSPVKLQRRLRISYHRAAGLIAAMEREGVISPIVDKTDGSHEVWPT